MSFEEVIINIVVFFIGGCFVSFGNCVRYRTSKGMDWVRGRSKCESCGKELNPFELVPVFSCLFLRGKCSKCGYKFGYNHAIQEAFGGLCAIFFYHSSIITEYSIIRLFLFGFLIFEISWLSGKLNVKKNNN